MKDHVALGILNEIFGSRTIARKYELKELKNMCAQKRMVMFTGFNTIWRSIRRHNYVFKRK